MVTVQALNTHQLKYMRVNFNEAGFITTIDYFFKDIGLVSEVYGNDQFHVTNVMFTGNSKLKLIHGNT